MCNSTMKTVSTDRKLLIDWYKGHRRDLPWRNTTDAYRIWISEVMLQQTTVTAVIPFYEKFMKRFPTVLDLAESHIENVYEMWAGLGYYSRARNLHKSAILISKLSGFPQSYQQLLDLPGFGPYTARAVSSLAFGEKTGVLDGNVIRVLSRRYGIDSDWWKTAARNDLQKIVDELAQTDLVSELNQGLMELGATICTPKKTLCLMCPWVKNCVSRKEDLIAQRPRARVRQNTEIWQWNFNIHIKKNGLKNKSGISLYLVENLAAPFLKKNWLPPSTAKQLSKKPKKFDFKHSVTKFDIYCTLKFVDAGARPKSASISGQWVSAQHIQKISPTSLMKKILKYAQTSQ